jgi:hypothetical protein
MSYRGLTTFLTACFLISLVLVNVQGQEPPTGPEPGEPTNLQASISGENIYLTWAPPEYTGDSAVRSYIVYRGELPGSADYSREAFSTSFEDMEVTPGTTYYYQVSAKNDQGEGQRSNEISFTIEVQKFTVTGRVKAPDSDEGVAGAHILIYQQEPPQEQFEVWTDASGQYTIELPQGSFEVRIEAEDQETIEEYVYIHGPQTRDFSFQEGGENGDGNFFEDINITDILGINEDEVEKWATRAAVAIGAFICALPLLLFLITLFLLLIFLRLGRIKKELRARNEKDGLFLSKRRKKKLEKKEKEEGVKPPKEEEEVEVKKIKKKEEK